MIEYSTKIEEKMNRFYKSLSEKDKRRYAGVEALKFGRGGVAYIMRVLGCSRKTVVRGLKELNEISIEKKKE